MDNTQKDEKRHCEPFILTAVRPIPKVTIITAVYNAGKYLDECISSVVQQTYSNFEYIIIDGGSTDGSIDIIKQYEDKISYWVTEPDKGIYDAWNKGLREAKGDWIAFVGSDDLLYPNAVENYMNHIMNHAKCNELEFVSSRIELTDENLNTIRVVGKPWTWNHFQRNMVTWHVGTFHSKQLFHKYGVFDPSYKISGDYELLLRAKDKLMTSFLDKITAKMRTGGVSSLNLYKAIDETYRAKTKNSILSYSAGKLLTNIDKVRLMLRGIISWKDST